MFITPALLAALVVSGQGQSTPPPSHAAIVQALLDYAEGYYGGEPERMAKALSPYLSKRALRAAADGRRLLIQMNADTLIDASHGAKLPPASRQITTEVLGVHGDVASARVFTAQFNDYVHLVQRNGRWQILNVLWHPPPAAAAADGKTAAGDVARQFASALQASDGATLQSLMHPLAHIRTFASVQNRPPVIRDFNADGYAMAIGSRPKTGGDATPATAAVEGVDHDIAAAVLQSSGATILLHLGMFDGQWRVVNVLSSPAPKP